MQFRKLGANRVIVSDWLSLTKSFLLNHQVVEIDFTSVEYFRNKHNRKNGESATYVSCVIFAISRVLRRHIALNSFLQIFPVKRLVIYDDIDISFTVEKEKEGNRWVTREIIRKSDKKEFQYFAQFLEETHDYDSKEYPNRIVGTVFFSLPSFVRRIVAHSFLMTSPSRAQRVFGTCGFTSVGKFGPVITAPLSPRTVTFSLGLIRERPIVRDGSVVPAKTGYITITYDHRVADGADVARMGNDLRLFLESFDERVGVQAERGEGDG